MSKVAVTGCAGFVGSWICEKLFAAGHTIIGLDNLSSKVNYTPNYVEFYNVDVNSKISHLIENVDAVVHASAYAELRHNWEHIAERDKLFYNNEKATRNILEQMPEVPIIFLSSSSVYGSSSNNLIKDRALKEEDANPQLIESPYAASKLACESYIAAWSFKRKTPWYSLRLVNQIGARAHRGVIVDFLRMIRDNKHIHAADNGLQKKNWVHVEDTADVIVRLLNQQNIVPSGIYNVTSDERWSWRDIVQVMYKMYEEQNPNSSLPFTLTFEDCLAGSIGDPINLYVSGDKLKLYYNCNRSVEKAVRESLQYCNWCA
jgi:UDP-glucose 4-epimerase